MRCSLVSTLFLLACHVHVAVAAPIDPSTVSGLTLWQRSDQINGVNDSGNPANGTPIALWTDSSTPQYAPAQGTGGSQPVYQTGSSPNGLQSSVSFDGVDDYLQDNSLPNMTASTIITAFRSNDASFKVYYHNQSSNSNRWGMKTTDSFTGDDQWHILTFTVDMSIPTAAFRMDGADVLSTLGAQHVYDITTSPLFGYSTPNTAEQVLHIGSPSISTSAPTGTTPTDAFYSSQRAVGAYLAAAPEYFDGEIGELIVFNEVLSAGDIAGIEEYLTAKFIDPLPPVPEPATGILAILTLPLISRVCRRRRRS